MSFHLQNDIHNAKEYLFLSPRLFWHSVIFISFYHTVGPPAVHRHVAKASYIIFDILGFNTGFYVRDLDLDPGVEVAGSPTSTNNLFQGGIQLPSAFFGTFYFHQEVLRARLPNSMDCDAQYVRFDVLTKVF